MKTRLILVNRYFFPDESATSQLATDLALALQARYDVWVVASRQRLRDSSARLPGQEVLDGVQIRRLGSSRIGRSSLLGRLLDQLSFLATVALWLLLHVRRGDVVLGKTDPPLLGVVMTLATLGRGIARVQWLQDLYPETAERLGVIRESGAFARLTRMGRDWSLRRSALVVTVSEGMRDYLLERTGGARLLHIPNWALDSAEGSGNESRDGPGLVVGYSGNLGLAHPIDGLLEIVASGPQAGLRFLITGGGMHHDRLRERASQLGNASWTFLDYQPRTQVAQLLYRADVHLVILDPRVERFIFPSKVFGLLATGRPILHLGDPGGEVARFVHQHGCGWSSPADDGAAILATLRGLQGDRTRLREAGANARRAHCERFGRHRALTIWTEALDALRRQTV